MRKIAILGSTGSIGRQALDVVAAHPDHFAVCGIAANSNVDLLARQANIFRPAVVSAGSVELLAGVESRLEYLPKLDFGQHGLLAVATQSGADLVVAATDGMIALSAVRAAIERGIDVALANKEIAVAAGELLFAAAASAGTRILPIDSEHSAVFQCMIGERIEDVSSIVLTASGGPFWHATLDELVSATPAEALRHPTWTMGAKNTVDSATLMNKGLEVIEACRFFHVAPERIEVVVHRQSIAHAFVIFKDGSVKSQLAAPDMHMPIRFALAYPERLPNAGDLHQTRRALGLGDAAANLTFEAVDDTRFPCLRLAYRAAENGGTFPAVLSAANEEAGRAFLQGKVRFVDIGALVGAALDAHTGQAADWVNILEADRWAREFTRDAISSKT